MPATLDVACPNCGKALKVPAELDGKRVKCKGCDEVFAVRAPKPAAKPAPKPAAAAKPAPKGAAKPGPAAKPAPPPPAPKKPFLDDEDDGPAKPITVRHEDDIPRCPDCAQELDPPDAEVCLNCGFNNRTRVRADSKRVVASDAGDWVGHLAPGVIALVVVVGLIALNVFCYLNMADWLSFLEAEEKNPLTGGKTYYVKPGAFLTLIIAVSILIIIPAGRLAVRRLILSPKPPENVKK
ncbi:MAG: zinc-ribbon domain-containing protein [Gemmataceae bacterium]|nr:zinc-ribbon domain-containing protein [Gemmataceae bacterium]